MYARDVVTCMLAEIPCIAVFNISYRLCNMHVCGVCALQSSSFMYVLFNMGDSVEPINLFGSNGTTKLVHHCLLIMCTHIVCGFINISQLNMDACGGHPGSCTHI